MFIGTGPQASGTRLKPLQADEGASLERELLLADGAADPAEHPRPARTSRTRWLAAATVLVIAGALGVVAHWRERQKWEDARVELQARLAELGEQSSEKVAALEKSLADRGVELEERKSAHQGLLQVADRVSNQLQACLADLRAERERNQKLEADYLAALKTSRPTLREAIVELLPPWIRTLTPERVRALEEQEKAEK